MLSSVGCGNFTLCYFTDPVTNFYWLVDFLFLQMLQRYVLCWAPSSFTNVTVSTRRDWNNEKPSHANPICTEVRNDMPVRNS